MKVISKGRDKGWKRRTSCGECDAVLEILDTDCRLVPDQRDGDYYEAKCPECRHAITIDMRIVGRR